MCDITSQGKQSVLDDDPAVVNNILNKENGERLYFAIVENIYAFGIISKMGRADLEMDESSSLAVLPLAAERTPAPTAGLAPADRGE